MRELLKVLGLCAAVRIEMALAFPLKIFAASENLRDNAVRNFTGFLIWS